MLVLLLATSCTHERERPAEREAIELRVSYGAVMLDVGRRFEVAGRAGVAGRFDLARYELGEIDELFEGPLAHADLPKEGRTGELPKLLREFRQSSLPDLLRASEAHDPSAFASAFTRAAAACNGCHQTSGHEFIEIPLVPGRGVPDLEPLAPPARD